MIRNFLVFSSLAIYFVLGMIPARPMVKRIGSIRCSNQLVMTMSETVVQTRMSTSYNDVLPAPVKPTDHDIYTGRDPARVKIFDTTLRDGEQSPGFTMNTEEKLAVARQLAKLGVDIIEAGFPVASVGDFEAVSKIAENVGQLENPPIICGLARSNAKDITTCYDAIKSAKFPRIHYLLQHQIFICNIN